MKTLTSLFTLLALSLISLTLSAGNGGATNVRSLVSDLQKANTLKHTKSGAVRKVTFTFTVNENGKVNAVSANVTSTEDRKALEKQFSQLTFNQLAQGVTYTIDVNFINY